MRYNTIDEKTRIVIEDKPKDPRYAPKPYPLCIEFNLDNLKLPETIIFSENVIGLYMNQILKETNWSNDYVKQIRSDLEKTHIVKSNNPNLYSSKLVSDDLTFYCAGNLVRGMIINDKK